MDFTDRISRMKQRTKLRGLTIKRKVGERVRLLICGVEVWVGIEESGPTFARLKIQAPQSVTIAREELTLNGD
jgi:sRNA-binding carbon storage regulator CsrA